MLNELPLGDQHGFTAHANLDECGLREIDLSGEALHLIWAELARAAKDSQLVTGVLLYIKCSHGSG